MDESDYYYRDIIEGASDADSVDSSDDDTDYKRLFDHGNLSREDFEVLRAADAGGGGGRWRVDGEDEDSNLSFEREMENEARNHVNGVHVNALPGRGGLLVGQQVQSSDTPASATARSLTSSAGTAAALVASTSKRREQENDELLYDPEEDERDQKWADAHRALHSAPPPPPPGPSSSSSFSTAATGPQDQQNAAAAAVQPGKKDNAGLKASQSDATLNCPCCLTLLCLDCQRHQLYRTQYRAMFVLNCRIDYGRQLLHRDKEQRRAPFKRSKKNKKPKMEAREEEEEPEREAPSLSEYQEQSSSSSTATTSAAAASDLYHPVHCTACNTQVALYDTNEVYHFFSVLASH